MVYPIVRYLNNPVLETPSAPVTEFDSAELHQLIDDMFDSMYAAKGVGLAAPQIGVGRRVAVIDCSNGEDGEQKIVLINPEILAFEGKQ
ncbi:MAG: peptide deformylase, partial [Bryobacteraceae bacterium]